jgi:hypothetical protein
LVVDDGLDVEEVVEDGFGGAIGSFHPCPVVGVRFDGDADVGAGNRPRGLTDVLLHVGDVVMAAQA